MRNKPLPVFFCASNALGLGASPPLLLAPACSLCPSGVVRSPLPALLVVRRGVGRGVVCRAAMRCGLSCRLSLGVPCRSAGRASAGRRAACLSVCAFVAIVCCLLLFVYIVP